MEDRPMSYYFSKTLRMTFAQAVDRATAEFKKDGFGVLTEIDVARTLKEKLGVDFREYRILGMCNPPLAYRALLAEDRVGLMLPCNAIVQDRGDGQVEVAVIDPLASMQAVGNPDLEPIGRDVRDKLRKALDRL
jgi:uncharacterized protein (DUF302 family)